MKASKAASSKFSILKKIRFGKTTSKVDAEKTLPPPNAKSEVSDQLPVDQESTEAVSTDTATEATSTEVPKTKDLNRHSPKSKDFRSSEYVLIGSFYQGSREELLSEYAEENERYQAASKEYSAVSAYWSLNKTCDHCGTAFDHGLVYLHEPTSQLVHVGHVCARKSFPIQNEQDFISRKLADLEGRWNSWLSIRQGSLLWRVGISILQGTIAARSDLSHALQALEAAPKANELENAARKKFTRWTRRGMLSFLIVAALSVASIIFTPLPLLIFVLILVSHFSGLLIRLILLARDVVRAQYRMMTEMDEYEQNYNLARQAVNEVVRLASVQDQFDDWQEIIREVVHVPFGKGNALTESGKGMDEVRRPPALVLGKSNPDTQQKMQLFLNARRQTIHAGWLTEIMDVLKEEWKTEYSNVRLTGPGDNIVPEADNAPSGSVVGKKPLSDENVYYPRTDFRFGVESGTLQQKLVLRKAEQIAEDLRKTPIDQLLGQVEVTGLGSALSGLPVQDFLAGLSVPPPEPVSFPPDLISDSFPQYRVFGPEVTLPPYGSAEAGTGQIKVESGVELTAATWRVELSDHLHPHIVLRGFGRTASDALHVFHENSEDEGVIP